MYFDGEEITVNVIVVRTSRTVLRLGRLVHVVSRDGLSAGCHLDLTERGMVSLCY